MAKQSQNAKVEKEERSDIEERLVSIRRVAKVVKGGRRFGFSALVVAGDMKGRVGIGSGKALEVMNAKTKATDVQQKWCYVLLLQELELSQAVHYVQYLNV